MADGDKVQDTEEIKPQDGDDAGDKEQADLDALLAKAKKDRSRANKEALAAKKERDALAAKLAEIEEAEQDKKREKMDEVERIKADMAKIAADAEKATARAASLERERDVIKAGVLPEYADVVANKLAAADLSDTTAEDWLADYKTRAPALYGDYEPPAPSKPDPAPESGAPGSPANRGAATDKRKELDEISKELVALRAKKGREVEKRKSWLLNRKFVLRAELAEGN